jgi:hypothetical protein
LIATSVTSKNLKKKKPFVHCAQKELAEMFESVIHNFAARSVVTFTLTTIMTWGLSECWSLYLSLKFATLGLHSHNPTVIYKSGFTPSSCQAIE